MESRKAFERWLRSRGFVFTPGGPYGMTVQAMWEAWQAREKTIQEAPHSIGLQREGEQ